MMGRGQTIALVTSAILAMPLVVFANDTKPRQTSPSAAPDERAALALSQSVIDRPISDFMLRASDGREVRLSSLRGHPLVVSFIYTGCFQACPTTTRFLAQVVDKAQQALGAERFRIASIGFNQPFDGPEAMAAFARQAGIQDPQWLFLSPDARIVEKLTQEFGFTFYETPKGFDHIAQVSIVDADGRIYRQIYGETFELPMLVGPLKELLSGQAIQQGGVEGLWRKVKLFCTVYDPGSGTYRLNYTLFFEIFAGVSFLAGLAWYVYRESKGVHW
jgi:protein SCO1